MGATNQTAGYALRVLLALTLITPVGCGEEEPTAPSPSSSGEAGHGPWGPCEPGQQPLSDGTCYDAGEGAGIAPDQCAEGFEPDGDGGCTPILPAEDCPPGQIAVPGDTACRQLAACGAEPWGDIPVDSTTVYVDGAYTGGSCDGSSAHPFTTIQAAVDAAPAGSSIAIAAGSYAEDVNMAGKALRLWGRCPALVEVVGQGAFAAVTTGPAPSVELRQLAITGPSNAVLVGGPDGLVHSVWAHDLGGSGVLVAPGDQAAVVNTLVDHYGNDAGATARVGFFARGSTVTIDRSVARDAGQTDGGGRGINVLNEGLLRADVTVQQSLVDRAHSAGLFLQASDVVVRGTVVRRTDDPMSSEPRGHGLYTQAAGGGSQLATVDVIGSLFAANREFGILATGAQLTIHSTVITDTRLSFGELPQATGLVALENSKAGPAHVTVTESVITDNPHGGLYAGGSVVVMERSVVRHTAPNAATGLRGRGAGVEASLWGSWPASMTVRDSLLERNHEAGLYALGADLIVESTRVRHNGTQATAPVYGRGLTLQPGIAGEPATTTIRWSVFEHNAEIGVMVAGAQAVIEDSVMQHNVEGPGVGLGGWGLGVQWSDTTAVDTSAVVRRSRVEGNQGGGIVVIGAQLLVEDTTVLTTAPNTLNGGMFGDGIAVSLLTDFGSVAEIRNGHVEANDRAGIAVFASQLALGNTTLECNEVNLVGEPVGLGFDLTDLGGNQCGCAGEQSPCKALSAQLEPPEPLEP